MSSSELSNALNPHIVAQRPRRAHVPRPAPATSHPTPSVHHAQIPQPSAPHRSELELAITLPPPPPPPSLEVAPVIPPPAKPSRNVAPVVQQLCQVIASARNAATAESRRRTAWEQEQEAKSAQAQAQMEQRLSTVQEELAILRAYITGHSNLPPPAALQDTYINTIPTTARIEPASPVLEPRSPQSLISPVSPITRHLSAEFVQGSSSRPLSAHGLDSLYVIEEVPSPAISVRTPPGHILQGPPTPQSVGLAPNTPDATPEPEPNARKRSRRVLEDDTDYDTDSEESDTPPTDRPLRRKNGHDDRCLTIHHALRIHIRKMMKLKHNEDLPDSVFEGVIPGPTEPVRFVWNRTTKQSAVNKAMKKRVVADLKAHRNKYRHVPSKDFDKKGLETAFEQVFTTLRQRHKSQGDATTAIRLQRREDHKSLKARRLQRKKTKLANRTEARKRVPALDPSSLNGALQLDCMSSEESEGEEPAPAGHGAETVQVFRTRGLAWRSARLLRMYALLDTQDKLDKSFKPKRGVGRRVRHEGPPKEGFFLPPKGVVGWMVSQRWIREMEVDRPDLRDILQDIIVDQAQPDAEDMRLLLGPEMSDEDEVQIAPVNHPHVSDTSYSLYNALQF